MRTVRSSSRLLGGRLSASVHAGIHTSQAQAWIPPPPGRHPPKPGPPSGQTPPLGPDTLPIDRQTPVKIQHSQTTFADGNRKAFQSNGNCTHADNTGFIINQFENVDYGGRRGWSGGCTVGSTLNVKHFLTCLGLYREF